jgi:hypothetical protein
MSPGILPVPRQIPNVPHTHLATVHRKNKCSSDSTWLQNRHVGSPVHFLLIILSLVRMALFSINQVKILILYGILDFQICL